MKYLNYIMLLLMVIEFAYVFTGNMIHEVLGLIFITLMLLHHFKYRKSMKKIKLLNLLLMIDLVIVGLSGLSVSRDVCPDLVIPYLSPDVHFYANCILAILLTIHIVKYVRIKLVKNHKKVATVILSVAVGAATVFGVPYLNRHYKTIIVDQNKLVDIEKVDLEKNTLVVYFTRLTNTDFEEGIDATSTASLVVEGEHLLGTNEYIAKVISTITNTQTLPIHSEFTYSSSYSKTCMEAKAEMGKNVKIDSIDTSEYDQVILVYPVWWSTIPAPVETFLKAQDWTNTKLVIIASHGGSEFGSSKKAIQKITGRIDAEKEIYCEDIVNMHKELVNFMKEIKGE